MVKDNTWATGTRIKSNSCSKITWSLFWNFSQVNREGAWKQVQWRVLTPIHSVFRFPPCFSSRASIHGKFVPSPLTYLPRTKTKMAAWWATMSLFRFGLTRKSLDTVTKSEDIQATQQLNSTKLKEPGDEKSWISTRSLRWEKQTRSKIPNFMGARNEMGLGFMLGIKVRRHKYWKFNETASQASWWFFFGQPKNTLGK